MPQLIKQTDMHMHTVTGLIIIRLGHESRVHFMVVSYVLDNPFKQHVVIARDDRIIHVMQIHLKLPRCRFGHDGVSGDALLVGSFDDVLKKFCILVKVIHRIDLNRVGTLARHR